MVDELNLLRLSKIKTERNEIALLKKKYDLFDINRFSLNTNTQNKYKRNINIVRKLVKLLPKYHFHKYIEHVKILRLNHSYYMKYLSKICIKYNIPNDLRYIIEYYI